MTPKEFLPPKLAPANLAPILTLVKYLSFLGYPLTIKKVGDEIEIKKSSLRTWLGVAFFLSLFFVPGLLSAVAPAAESNLSAKSYFTNGVRVF